MKKKIVVSAINIKDAGPLSILSDCLEVLSTSFSRSYDILALVHSKDLFELENIEFREFPKSKKSYFRKFFYEYYHFKKISGQINPFLWISLSDISPNVISERRIVYCHNAAMFYRAKLRDLKYTTPTVIQSVAYRLFYRINIKKNDYVVVQQEWLRKAFQKKWGLGNIVVCKPTVKEQLTKQVMKNTKNLLGRKKTFFYPSFPRGFKNFEIICEAYMQLEEDLRKRSEVLITVDRNAEDAYSQFLLRKYGNVEGIKFLGILPRVQIFDYYKEVDCMIFASKLESWGLPITEFKLFEKPILLAELPYAHETLGAYNKGHFFNPDRPKELSTLMKKVINGELEDRKHEGPKLDQPFYDGWEAFLNMVLK